MTATPTPDTTLGTWLALEREAVWTYSLIGARVPDLRDRARRSLDAHAAERDRLLALVGSESPPLQPSYDVGDVDEPDAAIEVARGLEERIQRACVAVVRSATPDDRALPVAGLRRAARAALTWDATPTAFPGLT